jgi:hypothetical protein
MTTARLVSIQDPRLTDLVRLGRGEGFSSYLGRFDGKPAFIVDCGTLNDFLDDEADATEDSVSVQVFETETERDTHVEHLRRTSPLALGVAASAE